MDKLNDYIIIPLKIFSYKGYKLLQDYLTYNDQNNKIPLARLYGKNNDLEFIKYFFSEPTHIIDNIYIGNARHSASWNILEQYNISSIINVTKNIKNNYEEYFDYYNISILDDNNDSIKKYLDESYNKIKKFQKKNKDKNILVHCFSGSSRSASVILYYIIKDKNNKFNNIDEAIKFMKEKRPIVNPSVKLYNEVKESC